MSAPITAVTLPKNDKGNDVNDQRNDPDILTKLKPVTPLDDLMSLSATSRITQMEANLNNDVYIFRELALSGQVTLFYAKPNTGKTLLFFYFIIDAIKGKQIAAEDVFYINADDNYRGLLTKARIAEQWGFHMISPQEANVKPTDLVAKLESIADGDQAKGKVFIIDTLKKFADMLNKASLSQLLEVFRKLVTKGGAVIIASHANKHTDSEGNLIYEGTSDIMNDVDCVYSMYQMSDKDDDNKVIEFRREKDRGDVIAKVSYRYTKGQGDHYLDLINSIERVGSDDAERIARDAEIALLKLEYESETLFVEGLLKANGSMNQISIINELKGDSPLAGEVSLRKLRTALNKLSGICWTEKRGEKNARYYDLIGAEAESYRSGKEGD